MRFKKFKINFFYSPPKAIVRRLFGHPSPNHWEILKRWNNLTYQYDTNCLTVYGDGLGLCGYHIPRNHLNTLFIKGYIELPNDPIEIIGRYAFNQRKIIELSKKDKIEPALVLGSTIQIEQAMSFEDKFISVAAAAYRGDKNVEVFAPYYAKFASNYANSRNLTNFT